ncbi:hypothetical protein BC834DRAFT_972741 [Gloeopeniophorella convolvens]|nr:hypothetical protein BC834DRAFT_972741 [Gloeopeniophorella convolvens]
MICNCWRKSGILPDDSAASDTPAPPVIVPILSLLNHSAPTDPTSQPQVNPLPNARSRMHSYTSNDVCLAQGQPDGPRRALNPSEEDSIMIMDTTDVEIEIYTAVSKQSKSNDPTTRGGESDDDDIVKAMPSHKDALSAASTLRDFVSGLNKPFARKLEAILVDLSRQTRLDEF